MRAFRTPFMLLLALAALSIALVETASAQDKPRYGGELVFAVPSEPPSYDGHQEETFGVTHPVAPHYNTLLRVDPFDRTGTKPVGDLAESWTVSKDGTTYTFKLRRGVKFHDGTEFNAEAVRWNIQRILDDKTSPRNSELSTVASVEVVDPATVKFNLKEPFAPLLSLLVDRAGMIRAYHPATDSESMGRLHANLRQLLAVASR